MMTTTKTQKSDLAKVSLAVSTLLTIVSFLFFEGFSRSEPWLLMALFYFNSLTIAFVLMKAEKTGNVFLWGVGAKGLKTFILFGAVGAILFLKLVESPQQFAAFFCLGFIAQMIFEVKYIFKEFGKKELEC